MTFLLKLNAQYTEDVTKKTTKIFLLSFLVEIEIWLSFLLCCPNGKGLGPLKKIKNKKHSDFNLRKLTLFPQNFDFVSQNLKCNLRIFTD